MIFGGGVAVCLLLSAHRAVIFAIVQLSCYIKALVQCLKWLTRGGGGSVGGRCSNEGHGVVRGEPFPCRIGYGKELCSSHENF